jgi:hypothetical protein
MPVFSRLRINTERLNEMFGSVSPSSISTTARQLLDKPRLIASIDTGYATLRNVCCLDEKHVWVWGDNKTMKLLDLQSKLLASSTTESGNNPWDITLTRNGDLVYIDCNNKTVNLFKNEKSQALIRLQGWIPLKVCSTSSDDLLVTMISDDETQSKVVRYSGPKESQTIQFDDQGRPLYSPDRLSKYVRM